MEKIGVALKQMVKETDMPEMALRGTRWEQTDALLVIANCLDYKIEILFTLHKYQFFNLKCILNNPQVENKKLTFNKLKIVLKILAIITSNDCDS